MLKNSIKMQMLELIRRKTSVFVYIILLFSVIINFFFNMMEFREIQYVSQMFDFSKVLTLSTWSPVSYYLMEYLPILIVIPTACSCLNDRHTRIHVYIISKSGKRSYWYGKLIAVFGITFLIFTIPFVLEVGLSCLCFDLNSMGDPSGFGFHQTIESDGQYFLSNLYFSNRVIYSIVCIVMFGIVAGCLAMWNVAVTSIPIFKYKIFTFFPIYILLFAITFVEKILQSTFTMNYFLILRMFESVKVNYLGVVVFLLGISAMTFLLIEYRIRKEEIL